ncbi:ABC transporter permease [Sedimentibacter sp. zth1]|uniref:ABC transporter permease n=1 Tax=Sedimentibacter sp. zth1 TaxID=2816908 RepID=UPI001A9220FD|nr:ABC transporter permease [Sedimentibacter sp. zth1]QSX04945.1 ABC transporter permease [Sedimentibacter sp. zth1]
MLDAILSPEFFSSILRLTTPILFATLAATIAAKSGIINMALEGIMLFCALFGVIFSSLTGSAWLGLLLTLIAGGLIGYILAFFVLKLKTDEIIAAIAINLIAAGGTVLLMLAFSGDRGNSASIISFQTPRINIVGLGKIPFLGEVLSNHNILTYFSLISVVILHFLIYKTPLGLKIRAVGENKDAAESVGISSQKVQFIALIISGVLAAAGGFFLSGGYMTKFTTNMTAGRGYIALAASSMGGNTPIGGLLVSIIFGTAQALANAMQLSTLPSELVQMLPYLVTIVGLGFYSYRLKKKHERLSGK